jgi:MraZ protein
VLLGEYEHNMDAKGRVAIPSRFRDELGATVIITRGFDLCLQLFPLPKWQELSDKVSSLSLGNEEARDFRRMLFSQAADVEIDRQGRILIPQNLREYGRLGEQLVIAGLNTHCEIWSREEWERVLNGLNVNASTIAEHLSNLGI